MGRTTSWPRMAGVVILSVAALLTPVTPAAAAPTATAAGTVTGPGGEVLAGVPVSVSGLRTVTNSHGRYRIAGVPADTVLVVAATPPVHYAGGTAAGGYVAGHRFVTFPKGTTTTADVALTLGAAMSGRVVDDRTGQPIPGTTVLLQYQRGGLHTSAEVTTAADGTWWARGLDPSRRGGWQAFATGSGRSADAVFGWRYAWAPAEARVLDPGTVVKGVEPRLAPLAEIVARVTRPAGSDEVRVAAGDVWEDGSSRSILHPTARYGTGGGGGQVCATSNWSRGDPYGLAAQCANVAFSSTRRSTVSFAMVVGGGIAGTIENVGLLGAPVYVVWNGRRISGYPKTSAEHTVTYSITGVPTGTYVVHASDPYGLTAESGPLRVVQGKVTKNVDLTMH